MKVSCVPLPFMHEMRWAGGAREDELHCVWSFSHGVEICWLHANCASLLISEDSISQSSKRNLSSMLKFIYSKRNWQRTHYGMVLLSSFLCTDGNDYSLRYLTEEPNGMLWAANTRTPATLCAYIESHLTMKLVVKFALQHYKGNCDRH